MGQRVRVVRDGKVCDGDVSFLSPLRDTCTITYVDKTVETFVSVKRLRSASRDGGFAVLAARRRPSGAAPKSHKSLVRFKRGDRVEVRRGKTWAKRTVRSCEATGPGTADLTLADPWGNEEFHQLDASEGLDDVIRWEKRPQSVARRSPTPAPRAAAKAPRAPSKRRRRPRRRPSSSSTTSSRARLRRSGSASKQQARPGCAAARRRARVDCGHDWFDCTLTTREKQGTWRIRHADGAFENGVALDRLRERQWFAAGSLARVAYQDRWHDCKILAVSRDRKTCTVRYEDNGYAEENVPVAARLRELRYADPVAPVPLPDFSKPAPKPVSLASSSDRDSPAVVESKKKKKVPPPPPRFVEPGPSVVKPKAKPLRAKPDIDLTGDDDESPRKAPKPKQKPAAPHPPSKPKPAWRRSRSRLKAPRRRPSLLRRRRPSRSQTSPEGRQGGRLPPPEGAEGAEGCDGEGCAEAKTSTKGDRRGCQGESRAEAEARSEGAGAVESAQGETGAEGQEAGGRRAARAQAVAREEGCARGAEAARAITRRPSRRPPLPAPQKKAAAKRPTLKSEGARAQAAVAGEGGGSSEAGRRRRAATTEEAELLPEGRRRAGAAALSQEDRGAEGATVSQAGRRFAEAEEAANASQADAGGAAKYAGRAADDAGRAADAGRARDADAEPEPLARAGPRDAQAGREPGPRAAAAAAPPASASKPKSRPLPRRPRHRRPSRRRSQATLREPAAAPTPPPAPEPEAARRRAPRSARRRRRRPPKRPPPRRQTGAPPRARHDPDAAAQEFDRRARRPRRARAQGAEVRDGAPAGDARAAADVAVIDNSVLLHYKSGADVTSNEMDLTDKWLGKPVAALKAAFAKRMSLDADGLSTKRADGSTSARPRPSGTSSAASRAAQRRLSS